MTAPAATISLPGAGGLALAATRYGRQQQPPVLFLHGAGQTRHSWHATAQAVADAGFQSLIIDHRGHGDSDWPDSADYEFSHFADDLDAILAELDEPPVVIGASLGGIALLVAHGRHAQQRYRAVVLVDITPRIDVDGAARILGFMAARPDGFASLEEASELIATYTGRPRPDRLDGLRKVLRHDPYRGRWRWHWDPRFLHGRLDPAHLDERTTELHQRLLHAAASIEVPTMILRGGRSELVSKDAVDELVQAIPHARVVHIDDAAHMIAGDDNDTFTATVVDFVTTLR